MADGKGTGGGAAGRGLAGVLLAAVAVGLAVRATEGRKPPVSRRPARSGPAGAKPGGGAAAAAATAADRDRGRAAVRPSDIPAKGWKDVVWRTWAQIQADRVVAVGAGVAFYGLLAIFPFLTAFVSLYGLVADPASVNDHLQTLTGVLPGPAVEIIGEQMQRVAAKDPGTLGFGFAAGLAVALWSANAAMKALFDALNVAYGEAEKRGFLALNALTLLFTAGSIAFLILAIGALVVLPAVMEALWLGPVAERLLGIGRWPALFLVVTGAVALLYRFGPSRARPRWRWVTWGSAVAAVGFLLVSVGFGFYAANFGSYNETYGSLGAVIAFMTWLWLSATVVLVGAELNAEIEHQTARDSTTGPERPIGTRGAAMADTIGVARPEAPPKG